MKSLVHTLFVLSSALAFMVPAYPQDSICANYYAVSIPCSGPNNCTGNATVLRPTFGSGFCLEQTFQWCCNTQELDYTVGDPCSFSCDAAFRTLLKNRDVLEFALTHTLWLKDCSGHYGPSARLWDAPKKPIDLRPRPLSGIGS